MPERKTVTLVYDSADSLKCNTDIPNSFSVCLAQAFDANRNGAPGCVAIKAWVNDAEMVQEWHGRIIKLEATVEVEGQKPYVRPELCCSKCGASLIGQEYGCTSLDGNQICGDCRIPQSRIRLGPHILNKQEIDT